MKNLEISLRNAVNIRWDPAHPCGSCPLPQPLKGGLPYCRHNWFLKYPNDPKITLSKAVTMMICRSVQIGGAYFCCVTRCVCFNTRSKRKLVSCLPVTSLALLLTSFFRFFSATLVPCKKFLNTANVPFQWRMFHVLPVFFIHQTLSALDSSNFLEWDLKSSQTDHDIMVEFDQMW